MQDKLSSTSSVVDRRQGALSRWDNEGGGRGADPHNGEDPPHPPPEIPALTNSELVQLRIRVIALENVVIALLAQASAEQLTIAREMAAYIAPRPGSMHHPLTIRASALMIDLVQRADHFRLVHS